jgi:hypothetical protein
MTQPDISGKVDLRTFTKSFRSEILLQQAIAGLLARMPNVTGVQILQGSQEYGKDIIFYIPGGLGERILCACVVKNSQITGNAARSTGARAILHQAEQSLDTPHLDEAGRDVEVERIYVLTPYEIPPPTVRSIAGALRKANGGVLFIGGAKLFELFRQYWPEYFVKESVALAHLHSTSNQIARDSALSDIAFQYNLGSIDKSIMNVYVYPLFTRTLSAYELKVPPKDLLPSPASLENGITRRDANNLVEKLHSVSRYCQTAIRWGLCDADLTALFARTVDQFCGLLPKALHLEGADNSKRRDTSQKIHFQKISQVLALASDVVQKYENAMTTLRQAVAASQQLSSLGADAALGDAYGTFVSLCKFDEFVKSATSDLIKTTSEQPLDFSQSILNGGASVMISAPAGYGKTSFCRWHALRDAEAFSTGLSGTIPVYVALPSISKEDTITFPGTFLGHLGQSALLSQPEQHSSLDGYERIRLYLDGLDEIASEKRRLDLLASVREGLKEHPNIQLVLAARDYVYGDWLSWLTRVFLKPFNDAQIDTLVSNWLGREHTERERFLAELSRLPSLKRVMRTPLLATLTILVYRQTSRLPENRARLYEMFVELLSGGWDLAKGVQRGSKFGSAVKIFILKRLAYRMHKQEARELRQVDLATTVRSCLADAALGRWEGLTDELLQDGLIVRSGRVLEFSHQSFQEFLAAKSLMGDPKPEKINGILRDYLLGSNWWREVLCFYIALSGQPRAVAEWIESTAVSLQGVKYEQRAYLTRFVTESFPELKVDC